jgi:cystathionine beta-synthase
MSLMKGAKANILDAVGHTPIVKLNKVASHLEPDVEIYVKCEFMNPGGSVKDRIGIHMVEQAEKDGSLKPGGTIIEATSGNTGMGLAMAAAVRGYKCIFVMADKQSEEKRIALRSVGAQVVICPTSVEPEDPRSYYSVSKRLAEETPNSWFASQYWNPSNPETHYLTTGPEIWEQTGGEMDVFCCSIGTGGTVSGTSKYLREQDPNVKVVGVDPIGSIYFDRFHGREGKAHTYYVEGIGEDFMPDTMDLESMDDVMQVTDKESFKMARRLIREEGLLIGGSAGSAVAGAIKYGEKVRGDKKDGPLRVLVILPDSSSRYLSKFLDDEWLRDAGFLEPEPVVGSVRDILERKASGDGKVVTATPDDALGSVVDRMKTHGFSQLPVVDANGLRGIVTEVRVLDALVKGEATMKSPAGPLASMEGVAEVQPETSITDLTKALADGRIAVVTDGRRTVGVVTKIDLIEQMAAETRRLDAVDAQ